MTLFQIDNLSYDVPGRRLLDNLSLTLPKGRMIGLIGHNGSGKSTLLKLLSRQITGQGRITFEGRDLAQWPARDYARRLAYMPQHTPPAEGMLVEELVALGRYPWHGALGRPGPKDREAIETALHSCGLTDMRNRQVDTMSGGEAQRAWLAMLVAQEAGCLLLDEPISALDIAHQVEVLDLVRRLTRDHQRSVIVVLHDLNMAARYCDHIVALSGGQLALQGAPHEILTADALQRIYGVSMEMLSRADGTPVALPH